VCVLEKEEILKDHLISFQDIKYSICIMSVKCPTGKMAIFSQSGESHGEGLSLPSCREQWSPLWSISFYHHVS
jgi:hypothetical protein